MIRLPLAAALLALPLASPGFAQEPAACAPAPEPVFSLSYGSRYTADSENRSDLDADADAAADEALGPIDDFLRDLTRDANAVFEEGADKAAIASCLIGQIAVWAAADAMSDLQSPTARLTIGSRIAGFSLVLLQVQDHAGPSDDLDLVRAWLGRLMQAQMVFWEEEAPDGAKQGNLRAWAALAGAATSALVDDPVMRGWSAWSVRYILCKAEADGSLPQEMSRGKYALKYQFHAVAPLVVGSLLLDRQGIQVQSNCENALDRIVGYALGDMETGSITAARTGETQSFFDGTDELKSFYLAWLEAYLLMDPPSAASLEKLTDGMRPLNYSKLGGNQTVIWQALRR